MGKETGKVIKAQGKPKQKGPGRPFKKGEAPKSPGRPKVPEDVKEAFRALTPQAVATLFGIMTEGEQESNRLRAAEIILNRAWGTPTQAVDLTGGEGVPLEVIVRYVD